jgi:hypothetical protein
MCRVTIVQAIVPACSAARIANKLTLGLPPTEGGRNRLPPNRANSFTHCRSRRRRPVWNTFGDQIASDLPKRLASTFCSYKTRLGSGP